MKTHKPIGLYGVVGRGRLNRQAPQDDLMVDTCRYRHAIRSAGNDARRYPGRDIDGHRLGDRHLSVAARIERIDLASGVDLRDRVGERAARRSSRADACIDTGCRAHPRARCGVGDSGKQEKRKRCDTKGIHRHRALLDDDKPARASASGEASRVNASTELDAIPSAPPSYNPPMQVLGIETSCDETGLALYDTERGLLSHALHSQVAMHEAYGGVVPELASRDHIQRVVPLAERVLAEAGSTLRNLDGIAYTQGPGLAGALLVGASVANALGYALGKPVVGVHHLEGHLLSPLLADPKPAFPFVALLVSGGHSQLFDVEGVGRYRLLGDTLDDAAGEAFDKTAKLLGLSYPGRP